MRFCRYPEDTIPSLLALVKRQVLVLLPGRFIFAWRLRWGHRTWYHLPVQIVKTRQRIC
jgi:hypothetical protein